MTNDIAEFCRLHGACEPGRDWALANCASMADAWEKLKPEWLIWVATCEGVLDDRTLRKFTCWSTRQIWHLLADARSRHAVEVAERFADGLATDEELNATWEAAWEAAGVAAREARTATGAAAWVAAWAAWEASGAAAWTAWASWAAAGTAAWEAARAAAWAAWASGAAARAAVRADQANYLRQLSNPFAAGFEAADAAGGGA